MQRALSFDHTPSLAVPLRFFFTAPVFALAAGLFLLWQGEAAFVSRWAPPTLALTHLLTLGFMAMCMIGSLLQILPVVAGVGITAPRLVGGGVHALLTAGTLLLCCGFVTGIALLLQLAVPLLGLAFALLLFVGVHQVWRGLLRGAIRRPPAQPVLGAIRLALIALMVTVMLGIAAASAFGWRQSVPLLLTDLHASWGLIGWIFLLTAGVAYQVVPMFQQTPSYPPLVTRWLAGLVLGLLALWSGARVIEAKVLGMVPGLALAALAAAFALYTMWQIGRKKLLGKPGQVRSPTEAPTLFWLLALSSLAASVLVWLLLQAWPSTARPLAGACDSNLLVGVLFLAGFAVPVVNGMLYKIVPFLTWYHLQSNCIKAPNVRQFLPNAQAIWQFRVHVIALALLSAAALWPSVLARTAGAAFALSMLLLCVNLWRTLLFFRSALQTTASPRRPVAQMATG